MNYSDSDDTHVAIFSDGSYFTYRLFVLRNHKFKCTEMYHHYKTGHRSYNTPKEAYDIVLMWANTEYINQMTLQEFVYKIGM